MSAYSIRQKAYMIVMGFIISITLSAQAPPPYNPDIVKNFIRIWDAKAPEANYIQLMGRPLTDVIQTTNYFDGLGRPLQSVVKQGSQETGSSPVDFVAGMFYDAFGREQYQYLPSPSNNTGGQPANDGNFKLNPFVQQGEFMLTQYGSQGESHFYSQRIFEASPLSRIDKTMAPGLNWAGAGRGTQQKYWLTTAGDTPIKIWTVVNATPGVLGTYSAIGTYQPGDLYKTLMVDEQGKQVIEYRTKEGQVILKKVQLTANGDEGNGSAYTGWLCTYYIYDQIGNLRCVIQPKAVDAMALAGDWALTADILDKQCFRYEYDSKGRMIMKKVPGAGCVYLVYDRRDRMVMTRDGNLTQSGQWLVTLYDEANRPVQTGLWQNTGDFFLHSTQAASSASYIYPFSTLTVPAMGWEMLTQTHYDDYSNLPAGLTPSFLTDWNGYFLAPGNQWPYPVQPAQSLATRGFVTWTAVKVLGSVPAQYLVSVNIYDDKARVIQVKSQNMLGGLDVVTTQYSWSGTTLVHIQKSDNPSPPSPQIHAVIAKYEYDDLGRLLTIRKAVVGSVDTAAVSKPMQVLVRNEYDKLGQLKKKDLGVHNLETERFDYNVRGWLLGMNRDYLNTGTTNYFGYELGYDKLGNQAGRNFLQPQFNGNISGLVWKSRGDQVRRKYDFTYDAANRLMKGVFEQNDPAGGWGNSHVNFSILMGDGVDPYSAYDQNGNIKAMKQYGLKIGGSSLIDDLTYSYQDALSNKLKQVTDLSNNWQSRMGDFKYDPATKTAEDYSYDNNGNLVLDKNRDIGTIQYNYLNLPEYITMFPQAATWDGLTGSIRYTYDASGNKLKKRVDETSNRSRTIRTETYYCNGFIYESKADSLTGHPQPGSYSNLLLYTAHEEGRIRFKPASGTIPASYEFDYMLKDHLGNVRMTLTEQAQTDVYPPATMEDTTAVYEELFYSNLPATRTPVPNGYPWGTNQKAALVKGNGNKIGPAILLKVMEGDKFSVSVKSWWTGIPDNSSPPSVLTNLANALSGNIVTLGDGHIDPTELATSGLVLGSAAGFLSSQGGYDISKPKAFVNWLLVDEQFRYVSSSSGFQQVRGSGVASEDSWSNLPIHKSGYLYIYVSNETPNMEVWFDDLQVSHIRGPILEETHYYPFGLTMAGISSKALGFGEPNNRNKYNGKEEERNEFSDGRGLEWLDFGARMYDAQLGRWNHVDPLASQSSGWSPYRAFYNNPIFWTDPTGAIEYESAEAFAKANKGKSWDTDRGKGDWLKSDRENNTDIWNNANMFNLQQKDGNLQYSTITQRAAFYGWFQKLTKARGFETKWAGAAYIIAQQMSLMDDPLIASMTGNAVVKFANDGNKAIFDDVFDNLRDLLNGTVLKGNAASQWDAATLIHEQRDVVQPIYARQTATTIKTLQSLSQGTGLKAILGYMFDRRFPVGGPLRFEGNISNWQHRYNHGMNKAVPFYNKYGSLFNWNRPGDGRIDTALDPDNPGVLKYGQPKE